MRTIFTLMNLFAFGLMSSLACAAESNSADWPTYQNAGQVKVTGPLPVEWSPEKHVAWSSPIVGYGQSAPVVYHDVVVVTSTSGDMKQKCHLSAYTLQTGKELWTVEFKNPSPIENTSYVSRAAPTPLAGKAGVIAFYEGGLVVAVDWDGKTLWERNLVADYGEIASRHGLSASVESDGKHVFVWVERSESPYVLALDPANGKTVWKSAGLGVTSWSSPRLVQVGEKRQLVCSGIGKIIGLDPETGKQLWEFADIDNNSTCTPIPLGDGKFLIGASDGRGEETAGRGASSNGVVQIQQADDGTFKVDFLWRAKRASSSFGNPVPVGKDVCIVNRSGVMFLLNAETGEQTEAARVECGSIWATPIVTDAHLYLFGQKGTTSVISLETGKEIATNPTWGDDADAEKPEDKPAAPQNQGPPPRSGSVLYAAAAAPPYLVLRRGDRLFAVKVADSPE